MTIAQNVSVAEAQDQQGQPRSWGDIAVSFAGQIAQLAEHHRGDLAGLRRMNPAAPDVAVFWRLMAREGLLGVPAVEAKWALILHGIALMTPTSRGDANSHTAHDGSTPVGRALFLGGESRRESALYGETRLNRLLTSRGPMLRTLLARMFRMMAAANVSFNWREMAQFILNDGYDEGAAEDGRRRIARDYYRAEHRSSQQSEE